MIIRESHEEMPLVSIITPSYNQGKFIKETIESVLRQDYPNIEYLVIDGGSTDETVDILKSYGKRITWVSEKDEGQADAVNKGILAAHGSIIGWLNSDDTYIEGAISHVVNFFRENDKVDMVYGGGYFIDVNSNIIDRYNTEKFNSNRLAGTCIICQPTAFFTKDIVVKVGLLDKRLDLCMDYELWMKIDKIGKIKYTSKYLATSRMYLENKTLSRKNEVYKEACGIIYKYYGYIPFSWLYGYSYILNKKKRNAQQLLILLKYNIKYNMKHIFLILYEIMKIIIRKIRSKRNFSGRYEDEWIAEKYICNIKANCKFKKIIIVGNHIWPLKDTLEICVRIDGYIIGKIKLKDLGDFRKEIDIEKFINAGNHKIELNMSNYYCPNDSGIIKDKRKLTFKLSEIITTI